MAKALHTLRACATTRPMVPLSPRASVARSAGLSPMAPFDIATIPVVVAAIDSRSEGRTHCRQQARAAISAVCELSVNLARAIPAEHASGKGMHGDLT